MPVNKIIKKSELDKFYTNKNVALECLNYLKPYLDKNTILIEPSAGNGSFSDLINCTAYDVKPENENIIEKNFFDVNINNNNICIFGNPPFGSRSCLAKEFIKHSLNSGIIAFILPEVFMKFSYQRIFPHEWKLVFYKTLKHNAFLLNGESYHVPAVFQIWIKNWIGKDLRTKNIIITDNEDFTIVDKNDSEGIIFSFGSAPSKIINRNEVKENNRGYFLKPKIEKDDLIKKIKAVKWNKYGKSSVNGGVFWLTKTEYITAYEDFYSVIG